MRTATDRDSRHPLKTATAIADPVLVRVSTKKEHILLLAQDASYERAGTMQLHRVQWMRLRRGVFRSKKPLAHGTVEGMKLLLKQQSVWVALPGQASIRTTGRRRDYHMAQLSRVQYEVYATASGRRLLLAAKAGLHVPRPSLMGVVLAIYRVRNTGMMPKVAR